MRTLVVSTHGARLRIRKDLLVVEARGSKQEIPVADLDQVIIATGATWFSSRLVRRLMDYGVDFVILDPRGYPIGRVYPVFINKTVETRRAQYAAYSSSRGVELVKEIVKAKILNQAGLLKRYYYYTRQEELRDAYRELVGIAGRVESVNGVLEKARDELRGLEATAARVYWASYALLVPGDLGFQGRDQESGDPVNTCLNYGYGILYGESWKALVLAGLDPYAGFMHADRSGKPSLVFDFIEMFRFVNDMALLSALRKGWRPKLLNGLLDYESRARIVSEVSYVLDSVKAKYMSEEPASLRSIMKRVALQLASYLRGESGFQGFVHEW